MLKPQILWRLLHRGRQPPSGGCVLKLCWFAIFIFPFLQPPSGGCVLKQALAKGVFVTDDAAAFRRLCVETKRAVMVLRSRCAAAFRRLCVETPRGTPLPTAPRAAAFRRLCVETLRRLGCARPACAAAFRRLCVETSGWICKYANKSQPPSGGCVLKHPLAFGRFCRRRSRLQAAVC